MKACAWCWGLIALFMGSGCATTSVPKGDPIVPKEVAIDDKTKANRAFVIACDRMLLRGMLGADAMSTVAARNDHMLSICDSVLAVGGSAKADPIIVAEYHAATRALRAWLSARPDWRTFSFSVAKGMVAALADSLGTGGVAFGILVTSEQSRVAETEKTRLAMREAVERCNQALTKAGYPSAFFRSGITDS